MASATVIPLNPNLCYEFGPPASQLPENFGDLVPAPLSPPPTAQMFEDEQEPELEQEPQPQPELDPEPLPEITAVDELPDIGDIIEVDIKGNGDGDEEDEDDGFNSAAEITKVSQLKPYKVRELRELCREFGLRISGTRKELEKRLLAAE